MTSRANSPGEPSVAIEVILDRIATRSDLELTETRLRRRIVAALLAGMSIVAAIAAGASVLAG